MWRQDGLVTACDETRQDRREDTFLCEGSWFFAICANRVLAFSLDHALVALVASISQ
jgi:hypothetical protein